MEVPGPRLRAPAHADRSNLAKPKVDKKPPAPLFDKPSGVILLCGAPAIPNTVDPSAPASSVPSHFVGEGCGESRILAKVLASNVLATS